MTSFKARPAAALGRHRLGGIGSDRVCLRFRLSVIKIRRRRRYLCAAGRHLQAHHEATSVTTITNTKTRTPCMASLLACKTVVPAQREALK